MVQPQGSSAKSVGRMVGRFLGSQWTFASGLLLVRWIGFQVVQQLWPRPMRPLPGKRQGKMEGGGLVRCCYYVGGPTCLLWG